MTTWNAMNTSMPDLEMGQSGQANAKDVIMGDLQKALTDNPNATSLILPRSLCAMLMTQYQANQKYSYQTNSNIITACSYLQQAATAIEKEKMGYPPSVVRDMFLHAKKILTLGVPK